MDLFSSDDGDKKVPKEECIEREVEREERFSYTRKKVRFGFVRGSEKSYFYDMIEEEERNGLPVEKLKAVVGANSLGRNAGGGEYVIKEDLIVTGEVTTGNVAWRDVEGEWEIEVVITGRVTEYLHPKTEEVQRREPLYFSDYDVEVVKAGEEVEHGAE